MDIEALVGVEFKTGVDVLELLDAAGLDVKVALWLYADQYEDWPLALASPHVGRGFVPKSYLPIFKAMDAAAIPFDLRPTLMIRDMTDPFVRVLRREYGKLSAVPDKCLGPEQIGDRFVEDAIVYLIQ